MAQIDGFYLLSASHDDDLLCQVDTLESAMTEIREYLTDNTTHKYFPIRVVMVDSDDRETPICTVTMP